MKSSVRAAFFGFTIPLEGAVPFMYLDILGLVTTAIGVLCNTKEEVRAMPWLRADGHRASVFEIDADFERVSKRQDMAKRGGLAFKSVAQLRLSKEGMESVTLKKLAIMEGELLKQYADFESWPADVQLAVLSMSWACGPWFGKQFKHLKKALLEQDWAEAEKHCHINTNGPDGIPNTLDDNRGVIPRNVANKAMFRNGAVVQQTLRNKDCLFFPDELDPLPGNAYDPSTIQGYQKALTVLGYDLGAADGVVGSKTLAAVKKFQADHNLTVDGKVGPKTQTALLEELQKRKD